jgi:hypothetical protein
LDYVAAAFSRPMPMFTEDTGTELRHHTYNRKLTGLLCTK